jgi:hypothetical protein
MTAAAAAVLVPNVQVLPFTKHNFLRFEETNIPGADIACGQTDTAGAQLQTCRICGGRAAVLSTCDANPRCVGFVMDGSSCGYLKGAKGPQQPGAYFWTFVKN